MAITSVEYSLFRSLREQGVLPLNGNVLELGEANWYGDATLKELADDIHRFAPDKDRHPLIHQLDEIVLAKRPVHLFEICKVFIHSAGCGYKNGSTLCFVINGFHY